MTLGQRVYWLSDTVRELWRMGHMLPIAPRDRVLDVGSGASPHYRSNVLCDKFAHDPTERHGAVVLRDRPFIVGDVQRLPFADHSFDFVICSHVLEHVEDPRAAVAELTRVAPRGYIETPSAEWERLVGFPFHRWMVSLRKDTLVFRGKTAAKEDPELQRWFEHLQRELKLRAYIWWRRRAAGVYTWLLWEGAIALDVEQSPSSEDGFQGAKLLAERPCNVDGEKQSGRFDALVAAYGRRVRRLSQPSVAQVAELLRCPQCGGGLESMPAKLRCSGCAACYPVDAAGTPWLLTDSG